MTKSVVARLRLSLLALGFSAASCVPLKTHPLDSNEMTGLLMSALLLFQRSTIVAVGSNCSIWTTVNGTSWDKKNGAGDCSVGENFNAVKYAGGSLRNWVAVGGGSNTCRIIYSTDGESWTGKTCHSSAATKPLHAIAFGNNTLVAGGTCINCATCASETYHITYATNPAADWTLMGSPFPLSGTPSATDRVASVIFSNGKFFMSFNACTAPAPAISSDNGTTFAMGTGSSLIAGFKLATGPKIGVNPPRILAYGQSAGNYNVQTTDSDTSTWSAFAAPAPFGGSAGTVTTAVYGTRYAVGGIGLASGSSGGNPGDAFESTGSYSVTGASTVSFNTSAYYGGYYYMGGSSGTIIRSPTGIAGSWEVVSSGWTETILGMDVIPE